jgi:acyl-CoA thioesterase-1
MNHILRIGIPLAVFVIGVILVVFLVARHEASQQVCATKIPAPRIVAFGDSLVEGYGATNAGGFVSILSTQAGVPILNLGKNGDTSAQANERVTSVIAARPTITLVLLGGNDALQGVPQLQTEQNLDEIITSLQKNGSKVVLLGVIGGLPDPYAAMFDRLSAVYGVTYVPNVLSGIIGRNELMSDSVHPNQAGYQKIADRLLPVLQKECGKD